MRSVLYVHVWTLRQQEAGEETQVLCTLKSVQILLRLIPQCYGEVASTYPDSPGSWRC